MEPLQTFAVWFWISLVTSSATGALWFLVVYRREAWLRWTNSEAAFWRPTKMPVSIIERMKQIEQSRAFIYLVGGVCIAWLLLMLYNAGAYIYFRESPGL